MKKISIVLYLVFLAHGSVYSQFRPGYVITNDNDTISGEINFEGSVKNTDHCTFRQFSDSTEHIYKPGDIKAFRFNEGKYFISYDLNIDGKIQKVFLEWLIKGRASILTYSPPSLQSRFYILLDNDSLYELKNSTGVVYRQGYSYEVNKKEYIGALKYYFNDCPSLFPKINNVAYSEKSLINIAKQYHEKTCKDESCIVYENKRRSLYSISPTVSYLRSQLLLRNGRPENTGVSKVMGIGLELIVNRLPLLSPKFSFRTGLSFYNIFYYYDVTGTTLRSVRSNYLIHLNYLRLPFQFEYQFFQKKLSPLVFLGANANIRRSYDYNQDIINYVTTHFNYDLGLSKWQAGVNGGVGMQYLVTSDIGFNLRIEYEKDFRFFGTYSSDYSQNNNFIIQAGCRFSL